MKCFVVFVIAISCAAALVADSIRLIPELERVGGCKSNSDCNPSQCCVDNSRLLIATKRDLMMNTGRFPSGFMPGGHCVDYIAEEGNCHYASFRSCGCIPGTKCKYYPAEPLRARRLVSLAIRTGKPGKRSIMFRPGTSKCEKPE